ncbi:hypothetical protein F5Y17DRAFT_454370 [Xylariaceae sp. FL0594]|nr:hypothetical protein F5Y17DRAFT_454370 [Xylariaceae sp. FL0594]
MSGFEERGSAKGRRRRKRPRKNRMSGHGADEQSRAKSSHVSSKYEEIEGHYEGDDDEPEDDSVQLLCQHISSTGSRLPKSAGPDRSLSEISRRFAKRPAVQVPEQVKTVGSLEFKRVVDTVERRTESKSRLLHGKSDSPDELAFDTEGTIFRPAKRAKTFPSEPSKCASKPATVAEACVVVEPSQQAIEKQKRIAREIIGDGLRIVRGVSGRSLYRAKCETDPELCRLYVVAISHTLSPVGQNKSDILERFQFLTVNLEKVKSIIHPDVPADCRIISITMSPNLSVGAGPKTMVEFETSDALSRFLETNLEHEFEEMEKRTTPRGNFVNDNPKEDRDGQDVKLIRHNRNKGVSGLERSRHFPSEARPPTKIKDAMKPTLTSSPVVGPAVSRATRDDQAPARRQLQTTRSVFALDELMSYESSGSEPDGWTSLHPGWAKDWRNSLVFPSKGKNRAIVDKDDIQRLDEGQFLNDNIIIFYLRYLQKKVEDEQPELAKRVYFHNTFFYDKLKPTKAGKGINYDSVKAWTSKVDLFSKDYIIVPINEHTHWYVAIICNASKLAASARQPKAGDGLGSETNVALNNETASQVPHPTSLRSIAVSNGPSSLAEAPIGQEDVIKHLQCMSIDPLGRTDHETKKQTDRGSSVELVPTPKQSDRETDLIRDPDRSKIGVEQERSETIAQPRNTTGRGQSIAPRKFDPNQPRIITLDSLGATHSPTCGYLKQYLVAELKDKKGLEAATTDIMGTTARGIPEQENHCDCGLFLLGYIQVFLRNPDEFVQSLLQRDDKIRWGLNPSQLRAEIRDCIFKLQRDQQKDEDQTQERKRQAKLQKTHTTSEFSGQPAAPDISPSRYASRLVPIDQKPSEHLESESNISHSLPGPLPPSNGRVDDDMVVGRHMKTSRRDAKHTSVTERSPGPPVVICSNLPREMHHKKPPSVAQALSPMTNIPAAILPRQSRELSYTIEAHRPMPGSFPVSPREANVVKGQSATPENKASDDKKQNFVPLLSSDMLSSKGSRGGTPLDPVIVEDSERRLQLPISDAGIYAQPSPTRRHNLVVEIGSRKDHKEAEERSRVESPGASTLGKGRVRSAKLREKPKDGPKDNVIDLSDD